MDVLGQGLRQVHDEGIVGGEANPLVITPSRGNIKPQWFHPYLLNTESVSNGKKAVLSKTQLEAYAYDYYLRFLVFFREQPEGTLRSGVVIEFTRKMRQKLGLAYLFDHRIKLNQNYFARDPVLLPYTLFHELTHLWLYDCLFDPSHTRRFYRKMTEFAETGLPVDPDVYIHSRVATEAKYVYMCPNCQNRWFVREKIRRSIYCGPCYELERREHFAVMMRGPLTRQTPNV